MFENVYVINMKEHSQRLAECITELNRITPDFKFTRIEGIKINNGQTQKDRESGCRASHMKIIKECKEKGINHCLIFEDDIVISDEFISKISAIRDFLNSNEWNLFYLGGNHNQFVSAPPVKITENIVQVHNTYTTHAYMVHNSVYDKILQYEFADQPIDVILTNIQKEGKSYCVEPRMIFQREGFSYIMNQHRNYDVVLK